MDKKLMYLCECGGDVKHLHSDTVYKCEKCGLVYDVYEEKIPFPRRKPVVLDQNRKGVSE